MPDFKPSDVVLASIPLVSTMGRAEAEFAAALIVRACQVEGDAWQPLAFGAISRVLKADCDAGREPFAKLCENPYFRPDVWDLVRRGYARWTDGPGRTVELTPDGIEALRRWVPAAGESLDGLVPK